MKMKWRSAQDRKRTEHHQMTKIKSLEVRLIYTSFNLASTSKVLHCFLQLFNIKKMREKLWKEKTKKNERTERDKWTTRD
jgi:hypothetical protein